MQHVHHEAIDSIRSFNRIYTREMGMLNETLGGSSFSLPEARILFELAQSPATAKQISENLLIDEGYLSRLITGLIKQKIIERKRNLLDGRSWLLNLSATGRSKFEMLEDAVRKNLAAKLVRHQPESLPQILSAMQTILAQFESGRSKPIIRGLRPGDIGWIIHRQAVFYNQEYGWNIEYEALVAKILTEFVTKFDAKCENSWIAESGGVVCGSVFLVKESEDVARLRLLFIEPSARGLGIGRELVRQCTTFSRQSGYKKIVLWTQSNLLAARHIYATEGYQCVSSAPHHSFGIDHVGETWCLDLAREAE